MTGYARVLLFIPEWCAWLNKCTLLPIKWDALQNYYNMRTFLSRDLQICLFFGFLKLLFGIVKMCQASVFCDVRFCRQRMCLCKLKSNSSSTNLFFQLQVHTEIHCLLMIVCIIWLCFLAWLTSMPFQKWSIM